MSDKPHFRFYPNAYAEGGPFRRSDQICDICSVEAIWLYTGGLYMEGEPPDVCARCIANSSLRRRLPPDSFTLQDIVLEGAAPALADEVLYATPGVAGINAFEWPVIDTTPLAFIGAGDDEVLKGNENARAAIRRAFAEAGDDGGHRSHALAFRQLDGDAFVAVLDVD